VVVSRPFLPRTDIQDPTDLNNHLLGVLVARVQEEQSDAIDDVSVGLPVEDSNQTALSAVEVVEGGLDRGASTPY